MPTVFLTGLHIISVKEGEWHGTERACDNPDSAE